MNKLQKYNKAIAAAIAGPIVVFLATYDIGIDETALTQVLTPIVGAVVSAVVVGVWPANKESK